MIEQNASAVSAKPGDDFIALVAIHVGRNNRVTGHKTRVNHVPLPALPPALVNGELVSVPRFDGGEKAFFAQMPDSDIARSALRTRVRIAGRDFGALPVTVILPLVK